MEPEARRTTHRHQTGPTFDATPADFLRILEGSNKSQATITAYRSDLPRCVAFLRKANCTISSPANVTQADVAAYLSAIAEQGITGQTRARKLSTLREFFRFP